LKKELDLWLNSLKKDSYSTYPFVILSYATSLDGSLSLKKGLSTPVSGPESLEATHMTRAFCDAILVGIDTVLSDNPSLTVRLAPGSNPRPVLLDSSLKIADQSSLKLEISSSLVFCSKKAEKSKIISLESRGAEIIPVPVSDKGLDLVSVLTNLRARKIRTLMVEGGGAVLSSFIASGLWDASAVTISPCYLSGYGSLKEGPLSEKTELVNSRWVAAGSDILCLGERDEG